MTTDTFTIKIMLKCTNHKLLDRVCNLIKEKAKKDGIELRGPIPLPTKRLIVPVRKSPDGEGSETWEKWEMRIHRRLIYVDADKRTSSGILSILIQHYDYGLEFEIEQIIRRSA